MLRVSYILCLMFYSQVIWSDTSKIIVGWEEKVSLFPYNISLLAKLDSGARMVSLHCGCDYFRKDGQTWARIKLTSDSQQKLIELPVLGYTRIKRHGGQLQQRPVVRLRICLAGITKETDVNLVDRTGMAHKLLIGRDYLEKDYLIDVAMSQLWSSSCSK